MDETITIEWTFSPEDYIEHIIKEPQLEITISNGKIKAILPASIYDSDTEIPEKLQNRIRAFFNGIMILRRESYTLSNYNTMERSGSDGKKHYTLFAETGHYTLIGGDVHFLHKDSSGNVIYDSKAEEKLAELKLGELLAKHGNDATVKAILSSYTASINDLSDELIHLYEIKDALISRFGGENKAKKTLGISEKDWSPLGKFSNQSDLKQGRHRGKSIGALRDATSEELTAARKAAQNMILAYLKYIN